jgi:hypothetical protein
LLLQLCTYAHFILPKELCTSICGIVREAQGTCQLRIRSQGAAKELGLCAHVPRFQQSLCCGAESFVNANAPTQDKERAIEHQIDVDNGMRPH